MAEYVGAALEPGASALRDLGEPRRCPDDLGGESHWDGRIVAGALWTIRAGLPNAIDRATMDVAVTAAIDAIDDTTGFDGFAEAIVAELAVVLGDDVATAAEAVFAERGVPGCGDLIRPLAPGERHARMWMLGYTTPLVGAVQFRLDLAEPSDELVVEADLHEEEAYLDGLAVRISVGAPIEWDADAGEPIGEVGWEYFARDGRALRLALAGPFPAGPVYLQLQSDGGHEKAIRDVRVTGFVGADVDEPDGPGTGGDEPGDLGGGCGCRSGGAGGGAWAALLALAGLLAGRTCGARRRRPTIAACDPRSR
jgi:MYXO-CTERM domain-containing protein